MPPTEPAAPAGRPPRLGLEVAAMGSFGWGETSLVAATEQDYRGELERLSVALTLYRRGERAGGAGPKSTNLVGAA